MALVFLQTAVAQKTVSGQESQAAKAWTEAVWKTKKIVVEKVTTGRIPLDSLNVDNEFKALQQAYPVEMSADNALPEVKSQKISFNPGWYS
jgi:hypothetical protein